MVTGCTNSGIGSVIALSDFMLIVVDTEFSAARMTDTPSRCKEYVVRSTDAPAWSVTLARVGRVGGDCSSCQTEYILLFVYISSNVFPFSILYC
jgi:hypothetical protein